MEITIVHVILLLLLVPPMFLPSIPLPSSHCQYLNHHIVCFPLRHGKLFRVAVTPYLSTIYAFLEAPLAIPWLVSYGFGGEEG